MKKSLVVIALVVAALCSLFVFSVSATEQENIHISSTEFQVRQGSEFTTTIYIADNANIIDFEVLLKYDTDKLTLISATENEDIKGAVVINAQTAGSIGINYSRTSDNVNKQTVLVDLTFRVDEYLPAGVYDCLTVDTNGSYVAHRLVNGLLEEVDFNCEFAPLSIYEIGDVDLNNKVDIGDATYIRRHLAKLHTLTDFQLLFANAQNDGLVDIADAVALQRNLAKLEVDNYGDRVNVLFCNTDGEILTKKSVQIGANLNTVPDVPLLSGYTNGRWSLSKTEYVAPDYTNLTSELTVYAIYEKSISPYMQYYMSQVNNIVNQYNGVITSDWTLPVNVVYASNTSYTATIDWVSSDANVFSNTGAFNEQTYDKTITLTAKIYSYLDSTTPESSETLTFTLLAKGAYSTPTKAEIVNYLKNVTNGTISGTSTVSGGEIDRDLNLIRKISNEQVGSTSGSVYEVRIEWVINNNGVYEPISQIKRGTSAKTIDLVATITFNGEPLEDDGKVYFDDVSLTAITEDEIRRYIIGEIASKVENSFSNGDALWTDEDNYGCEIKWISKDIITVVIEQNTVTVNEQAINGTTCPITVQVTYPTDAGSNSFELEYVITVENPNNTLLRPGVNVSESLYYALMIEMRDRFGYTQLTTEALKNTKFVSLDLSKYNDWFEDGAGELHPPVTDLTGLTYCENLRLLNISGLNITSGVSEIAGLTHLESFIANNIGISSEAVGGTPILSNMINLKLVDLSSNNLTSLDMFFSSDDIYSKLKELYLDNNNLSEISLLSQTPMLTLLTLSNNNVDSDDITVLADKVYLTYLSLNNNNISSISSLNKLTALTELRLHCNNISDITALKNMTAMTKLYLGENTINNIENLENLTLLKVLYLNNNTNIVDISAVSNMTEMEILSISNCSIDQIKVLAPMSNLKELYAENNQITAFDVLANFASMEKLLLAGNLKSGNVPKWDEYLGSMTNLKVLTLSGLDVVDLSFLMSDVTDSATQATTVTPKPIERLEIAGCGTRSEYVVEDSTINNIELLTRLKSTMKYLDISSNSINDNIGDLSELSGLELLYADNIDIGDNIIDLMANSQSIKYLSLENCNISNMYNIYGKPWLATSRKYVFVDLAQNPIPVFDFSFVESSSANLQYLYLDTTDENATLITTTKYSDNVLNALSLEGFNVASVNLLPNMDKLEVLNLANTGLVDLYGLLNADGTYNSIERFTNLSYINLGGNDGIFTHSSLNLIYECFGSNNVTVHLYSDYSLEGFDSAREMSYINLLALADEQWLPYGGNIVDYKNNNTNGLSRSMSFREFEIDWCVEDDYVAIENNKLYVKNIAIPSDEYTVNLTGYTELYGEECSIYASVKFSKIEYSITYFLDSDNNAYSERVATNDTRNPSVYAVDGKEVEIYAPSRGYYDYFLGWYEDAEYNQPFNNDLKDNPRNVILYAKWDVATYYDSIDETPESVNENRVVIDWSKDVDTNLLNHTTRPVDNSGYDNINISNTVTEITFIGDPSKVYTNLKINLCNFAQGQNLLVRLVDFNFVTNDAAAISLQNDNGVQLTIEVMGESSIKTTYAGGNIIVVNSENSSVKIVGSGNLTLNGGDGASATIASGNGGTGGSAIIASDLNIDITGSLIAIAGDGGSGFDGNDGENGATKGTSTLDKNVYNGAGTHIQKIYRYDQASNGSDGGSGGNGGNAGVPIIGNISVTNTGTITIVYGNGGDGGNGGNGGRGGDGHDYYAYTTGVSFIVAYDPGAGGNGGNGGRGGNAGRSVTREYSFDTDNVEINYGSDGVVGVGGNAGAGGNGGNGGSTGALFQEHKAADAEDGNDGIKGGTGELS